MTGSSNTTSLTYFMTTKRLLLLKRIGFRYWKNPGPFVQFAAIPGSGGQFLGFWTVLTQAAFSYIGTEIVAVRLICT
jgi:amino acid permease